MSRFNIFDYSVCLTLPTRLGTSAWIQHTPFAMALIALTKPQVFVELGTHSGVSYCAFCQAVKALNLPTRCYAVDTWQGDEHSGLYGPEVIADLHDFHDPLYSSFSQLLQSTFADARPYFQAGEIDLLHVDGYHTYEAVKSDFESWLPHLSECAIVIFHDINVLSRNFGVKQLWEELIPHYPHFAFFHQHGLGILGVGPHYPEALNILFQSPETDVTLIREIFTQLGLRVQREYEVRQLVTQIHTLDTALNEKSVALADTEQHFITQIHSLEAALNEKSAALADTEQHFITQIHSLEAALNEKSVALADTEHLKRSQAEWNALQAQLEELVFQNEVARETNQQLKLHSDELGLQLENECAQRRSSDDRLIIVNTQLNSVRAELHTVKDDQVRAEQNVSLLTTQLTLTQKHLHHVESLLQASRWQAQAVEAYVTLVKRHLGPIYATGATLYHFWEWVKSPKKSVVTLDTPIYQSFQDDGFLFQNIVHHHRVLPSADFSLVTENNYRIYLRVKGILQGVSIVPVVDSPLVDGYLELIVYDAQGGFVSKSSISLNNLSGMQPILMPLERPYRLKSDAEWLTFHLSTHEAAGPIRILEWHPTALLQRNSPKKLFCRFHLSNDST